MLSTIANTSYFYQVRPNAAQSVSSIHKNSSANAVKFGNNKAYYRALDPKATEHEIDEYADADTNWRNIIRNVETANGTNIFGIVRPVGCHTALPIPAVCGTQRLLPNL